MFPTKLTIPAFICRDSEKQRKPEPEEPGSGPRLECIISQIRNRGDTDPAMAFGDRDTRKRLESPLRQNWQGSYSIILIVSGKHIIDLLNKHPISLESQNSSPYLKNTKIASYPDVVATIPHPS